MGDMKPDKFFDENAVQKLKEQENPYSPTLFRLVLVAIVLGTLALLFLGLNLIGIPRLLSQEVEAVPASPTSQAHDLTLSPTLQPSVPVTTTPQSVTPLHGAWYMTTDLQADNLVTPRRTLMISFTSEGSRFSGRYLNVDNDSYFEGQTYQSRGVTLLTITQFEGDYYAVYAGQLISDHLFEGTWYDVNGYVGDFRMEQTAPDFPAPTTVPSDTWRLTEPRPFDDQHGSLVVGETMIQNPEFSFSIWFKTNEDRYAQVLLGNYRPCSYSDTGFILVYYGTSTAEGARLELVNGGGTDYVRQFGSLSDDQWHHAAGVFSDEQMEFYVDGESVGTLNKPYTPTQVPLQIGAASEAQPGCANGHTNHFHGEMADLRIYQYPLTETHIADLFAEKP